MTFVIPVFNEEGGVAGVLDRLLAIDLGVPVEVLVVDDGSTDTTMVALAKAEAGNQRLRVVKHRFNLGYGAALKTGISRATHDVIVICDADGTYPEDRIVDLIACIDDGAEMAIGARTGPNVYIPLVRRPAKAILRWLASFLAGAPIPDLNSGLRVFRREAALERFHLISDGFSFTTTITLALLARSRPVLFLPVDYMRRTGSSKIRPVADTFNFLVLILRVSVYFEPLKVFLPAAGLLALSGVAYGVVQVVAGNLGEAPVLLCVSALQILLVGLIADMISRRH